MSRPISNTFGEKVKKLHLRIGPPNPSTTYPSPPPTQIVTQSRLSAPQTCSTVALHPPVNSCGHTSTLTPLGHSPVLFWKVSKNRVKLVCFSSSVGWGVSPTYPNIIKSSLDQICVVLARTPAISIFTSNSSQDSLRRKNAASASPEHSHGV